MSLTHLMASSRLLRVLDAALAAWVAAWIGLGVAIGIKVDDLTKLSHTVVVDGQAIEAVGRSLGNLAGVPFVGGQISSAARQITQASASAVASGRSSASSIHALSILLAIAVALLPSVPVLCVYLPARLERRREARALREALRRYGGNPAFHAFLARRAVGTLDYHRLRKAAPLPWAELADAEYEALAAAELRRLGIDPRALHPPERSAR
jgi:hypothetical protein